MGRAGQVVGLVAALAADQGRAERGASLLSTVTALRKAIGQPESVPERVYQDRVETAVWRRLSEEAVTAQLAADNTMSLDEAVATATALIADLSTSGDGIDSQSVQPSIDQLGLV